MPIFRTSPTITGSVAIYLSWLLACPLPAETPRQVYVTPHLFDGRLYVGGISYLNPFQEAVLARDLGEKAGRLLVLGDSPASMARRLTQAPAEHYWTDGLWERSWKSITFYASLRELTQSDREPLARELSSCDSQTCIVLYESTARQCDVELGQWLSQQLRECLKRQITLCIVLDAAPESNQSPTKQLPTLTIAATRDLLPDMQIQRAIPGAEADGAQPEQDARPVQPELPSSEQRLSIKLPDDAWIRINQRELVNLATQPLQLQWPASTHTPQMETQLVEPRSMCDLVAARRALYERQQPEFPANQSYDHRLSGGSLVIVGGGGASKEIWERLVELAGGQSAKIVVLPTANPNPDPMPSEATLLRRLGAEVRVLPQTNRAEVEATETLETLRWATGVWFGGGRQWRFVDAYWGTPAWQEILNVAHRGGVIGGSSAGATIQGDLLVRGHPLGNQIMIADGYRRGLGLLPGVAIDQHFRQRNRFADLTKVVERFPTVLGIGIDEATALVVQAPTRCEVIGAGSVWLSYPGQPAGQARDYIERPTGSTFDLLQPNGAR